MGGASGDFPCTIVMVKAVVVIVVTTDNDRGRRGGGGKRERSIRGAVYGGDESMVGRRERVGRCTVNRGAIAEFLVGYSDRVRKKPSSERSLDPLTSPRY